MSIASELIKSFVEVNLIHVKGKIMPIDLAYKLFTTWYDGNFVGEPMRIKDFKIYLGQFFKLSLVDDCIMNCSTKGGMDDPDRDETLHREFSTFIYDQRLSQAATEIAEDFIKKELTKSPTLLLPGMSHDDSVKVLANAACNTESLIIKSNDEDSDQWKEISKEWLQERLRNKLSKKITSEDIHRGDFEGVGCHSHKMISIVPGITPPDKKVLVVKGKDCSDEDWKKWQEILTEMKPAYWNHTPIHQARSIAKRSHMHNDLLHKKEFASRGPSNQEDVIMTKSIIDPGVHNRYMSGSTVLANGRDCDEECKNKNIVDKLTDSTIGCMVGTIKTSAQSVNLYDSIVGDKYTGSYKSSITCGPTVSTSSEPKSLGDISIPNCLKPPEKRPLYGGVRKLVCNDDIKLTPTKFDEVALLQYMDECLTITPGHGEFLTDLYKSYKRWFEVNFPNKNALDSELFRFVIEEKIGLPFERVDDPFFLNQDVLNNLSIKGNGKEEGEKCGHVLRNLYKIGNIRSYGESPIICASCLGKSVMSVKITNLTK